MSHSFVLGKLVFAFGLLGISFGTAGAEIGYFYSSEIPAKRMGISLVGDIVPGDARRLLDLLRTTGPSSRMVMLNSKGGMLSRQ